MPDEKPKRTRKKADDAEAPEVEATAEARPPTPPKRARKKAGEADASVEVDPTAEKPKRTRKKKGEDSEAAPEATEEAVVPAASNARSWSFV